MKESEKAGLKLNSQKTKIMASGHITSWQIDGGNNGNRERLYFLGLKKLLHMVTAATKLRRLLLGIKAMANLESILKSRDITLPTKLYIIKATVFPVDTFGCER